MKLGSLVFLAGLVWAPLGHAQAYSNGQFVPDQPLHASDLNNFNAALQAQIGQKLSANQTITVSGDCSGSGSTAIPLTCAKTGGVTFGPFATGTDAANLTGTASVDLFNAGSGASSSTFLRGDGTWATPAGTPPGGSSGQLQYNSGGSFAGLTLGGDCSFSAPNITCTKTNGVAFAASATTDTTDAANISSGTLPAARLPTPNVVVCPASAPTKPGSSAWTMAGLGGSCAITPSQSGDVVAACTGSFSMSSTTVATDGIAVQIAYYNGAALANGAPQAGTVVGPPDFLQAPTSGAQLATLSVQGLATGLTLGTLYRFDLQAQQEGSNTNGGFFPISCTLRELP